MQASRAQGGPRPGPTEGPTGAVGTLRGMADAGRAATSALRYQESLRATPRSWLWFAAAAAITFLAIAPIVVPITLAAWLVNVVRYQRISIRVDDDYVWVGHRWMRLAALDLSTLG